MINSIDQASKVATSTVEALKSQPLALALIIINVLFLIAGGLFIFYIGGAVRAERAESDAMLARVIASCGPQQQGIKPP